MQLYCKTAFGVTTHVDGAPVLSQLHLLTAEACRWLMRFHLEPEFKGMLDFVFFFLLSPSTPILTWPDCFVVIILGWLHCSASQPLKRNAENRRIRS